MTTHLPRWMLLLVLALLGTGCASSLEALDRATSGFSGSSLGVRSQGTEGVQLKGGFTQGFYAFDHQNRVTVVLLDGPVDSAKQAVVIRMFWKPWAGKTPIDATATNASIHLLIFADGAEGGAAGLYNGAGFIYPSSKLGRDNLSASVWDSVLKLTDRSMNFEDLLGEAVMQGNFSVPRDDAATLDAVYRLSSRLSTSLAYPVLVQGRRGPVVLPRG